MNLILLNHDEIIDSCVVLTDNRAKHIIKVLRSEIGESVRIGVVNGQKGVGKILSVARKYPRSVTLQITLNRPMNPLPEIDLVLAMSRPIMMRRILSQATALGVGKFYLIHAGRVEKSFWEASFVEKKGYQEHLLHGLEQAMDTRLPKVQFFMRFKPFVEDYLPGIVSSYSHCLLMDPGGDQALAQGLCGKTGRILVAIGPEGGWVDYELNKFRNTGFIHCSLGERILKVDTAVVAIHARISQLQEMKAE